jgi:hypothetical protein
MKETCKNKVHTTYLKILVGGVQSQKAYFIGPFCESAHCTLLTIKEWGLV